MNRFQSALRSVPRDLRAVNARFALVGGMAVSARSVARFTNDLDFAVAVDSDDAAEAVVAGLLTRGYSIAALLEETGSGRMATMRLNCPPANAAPLICDLLFRTSGIEREVVADATIESVYPGLRLPLARTGHLIAMKVLAECDEREHDLPDLRRLFEVADDREFDLARSSLAVIEERGFARGKQLLARFEELRTKVGPRPA